MAPLRPFCSGPMLGWVNEGLIIRYEFTIEEVNLDVHSVNVWCWRPKL